MTSLIRRLNWSLVSALAVAALLVTPAPATPPGKNGQIAFARPDGLRIVFERQFEDKPYGASGRTARISDRSTLAVRRASRNADGSGLRRVTPWRLGAGDHPD